MIITTFAVTVYADDTDGVVVEVTSVMVLVLKAEVSGDETSHDIHDVDDDNISVDIVCDVGDDGSRDVGFSEENNDGDKVAGDDTSRGVG